METIMKGALSRGRSMGKGFSNGKMGRIMMGSSVRTVLKAKVTYKNEDQAFEYS